MKCFEEKMSYPQFLKYLDGQSKKVTELEIQDIADYVSILDVSDIKYSTFNRYITHIHTFLQVFENEKY